MAVPWRETEIPGVFRVGRPMFEDARGGFVKVIGEGDNGQQEPFIPSEIFWSRSAAGVFRGMHVQLPPHDGRKLVFVVAGTIRDFVVDLRTGSPSFGHVLEVELDESSGGLLIAEGCAHGFEAMSEAVVVYGQETFHAPEADSGVLYSSVGVQLSAPEPVISSRDLALPSLTDFGSQFGSR